MKFYNFEKKIVLKTLLERKMKTVKDYNIGRLAILEL